MMLTEMVLILIATCMVMVFAALQGLPHVKRPQEEPIEEQEEAPQSSETISQ